MNETEQLVTKDFLRVELQVLRAELREEMQKLRGDILEQMSIERRWNTAMILGVYAMIAIGYFIRH